MSGPDDFRPVNRDSPCVICGKPDWCRRSQAGAHECHRINDLRANGLERVATTPAGYAVYRDPGDQKSRVPHAAAARRQRSRVFDTPEAAAKSFAQRKGGTIENIYCWTDKWHRARIRLPNGKTFCEITHCESGWVLRGPSRPRQLYRINELPADGIVIVCEGEKACDAGWSIDLPCVTSGAADSARAADWTVLRGREVAILPDQDSAGIRYAEEVARQLKALDPAARVKLIQLPCLCEGEDLYDFINTHRDSREAAEIKLEILALIAGAEEFEPASKKNASTAHWPDPQPLPDVLPAPLSFDPHWLPAPLRGWIEDIAERVQCPIDYPAIGAMVTLAAVVGRKVGLRPKRQDDWLVVPNLWGAIIGRPGVMKSPALAEVLKPIKRLEVEAKEEHDRGMSDYATARMVDEIRQREHAKKIAKTLREGGDAHSVAEELIASETQKPVRRRYIINDSTVEKLGALLNENPNGILCYRDELVGLLTSLERDGQEGARAFYLEAWNGTGRFTYDRIGRGTLDIEACCISLIGGIQPGPLSNYLRGAVIGGKTDDGLLQRFQLAVWPDPSPSWRNVDRWPDTDARDLAHSVYRRLDVLDVAALGVKRDGSDIEGIPYLRFAPGAQEGFDQWRAVLEGRLRSGEDHPAIEAHLAKYRSLIPSLALLIHLAEDGIGPVSQEALERAIGWSRYLETHAQRIYAIVSRSGLTAANKLAKKLLTGALGDGFAPRDVYRHAWSGLSSRDEALEAVSILVDHDWLVAVKEHTEGAPRTRYWVNPRISELKGNRTDKTDRSLNSSG
jgi:hypothetical protein